jgi:hypothetical protein
MRNTSCFKEHLLLRIIQEVNLFELLHISDDVTWKRCNESGDFRPDFFLEGQLHSHTLGNRSSYMGWLKSGRDVGKALQLQHRHQSTKLYHLQECLLLKSRLNSRIAMTKEKS